MLYLVTCLLLQRPHSALLCALGHWPLVSPEHLLCHLNRRRHTSGNLKAGNWNTRYANETVYLTYCFTNYLHSPTTYKKLHFLWCGWKLWLERTWNHQAGNGFPQLLVSGDINSWHSSSSHGHTLQISPE